MTEQSDFANQQEIIQAPPEVLAQEARKQMAKQTKNRRLLYVVGGLSTILFILIVLTITTNRRPAITPKPVPTPTTQPGVPVSKTQVEIQRLQDLVKHADPESDPFTPPQVDMLVKF